MSHWLTYHLSEYMISEVSTGVLGVISTSPGPNHLYQKTFVEAEKMLVISVECHFSGAGDWFESDSASHWRRDQELPPRPLLVSEGRAATQTVPLWQLRRARPYLSPQTHLSGKTPEKEVSLSSVLMTAVQFNSSGTIWMCWTFVLTSTSTLFHTLKTTFFIWLKWKLESEINHWRINVKLHIPQSSFT